MNSINRILLATDFSPTANNALLYSLDLAQALSAEVSILHACWGSSASSANYPSGYYEAVSSQEWKEQAEANMKQLEHDFLYAPQVKYQCHIRAGLAADIIQKVAKQEAVDLIVMGTRRAEGINTWLGSVTIDTIRDSLVPVLVVPENARFAPPQRFVLATSYTKVSDISGLSFLKWLVSFFRARLEILHIHSADKEYSTEQAHFRKALDHYLGELPHHFHTIEHPQVTEGIEQYLDTHATDLLVMLPQQHKFFEQLWHASQTKKMVFHTHIPLLTLRS
jgi:nucleotide-binding universal stress UspA family protein